MIIFLFATALIIRLAALGVFYHALGPEKLRAGDANTFLSMAANLEQTGTLSSLPPPSDIPTANYPPLYPIFLLITRAHTSLIGSLAIQSILGALTVVLIYTLGARMGFSNHASLLAALIYAFEPGILFYTSQFYTETLFTALFLGALIALFSGTQKSAAASAILLGLATLTRPVGLYCAVLFLLFLGYTLYTKQSVQKTFATLFLFAIIFLAITIPWFIRNGTELHSYIFSTQPSYLAVGATIPSYISWHEHISFHDAQLIVDKEFASISYSDEFLLNGNAPLVSAISNRLYGIILHDPIGFTISQLRFMPQFFFSSGWQAIYDALLGRNIKSAAFAVIPPASALRIAGSAFWVLITLAAIIGVLRFALQNKQALPHLILVCVMILMFAFFTGALAHMRYRMPAIPFILLFAGNGFLYVVLYTKTILYRK